MSPSFQLNQQGLELSHDDCVDVICDAFEERWITGDCPDIGDFVSQAPEEFSSRLFAELILVDADYRARRGDSLSISDYLNRFPRFAAEVETVSCRLSWTTSPASGQQPSLEEGALLLDRFVIGDRLGAGAAGEVWKARDTQLQRTVAIKIPNSAITSKEELHRFVREGRTAAQLRHGNIVAVHEASHEQHTAFIVSDYIDGRNLRQHLLENRLSYLASAKLCEAVGRALHYAHQRGVVHRDLKPANIILDGGGTPHITDFGLAKWTGDAGEMTLSGQILGTPAYMSPEQARGESAEVDHRADVYALGVVLYELLTGRCPFTGVQAAVLAQIIGTEPARPRHFDRKIPRDLETICLKAIEKDPNRRYATAEDFANDLDRYQRGENVLARRAGIAETAWRYAKRRPAVAAITALTPAVLVLAFAASSLSRTNHQLLGLQTVRLATTPPGARIVFVPLDDVTGAPATDSTSFTRGRSPIECELAPGSYVVTAILDDGRFHEVQRHVPKNAGAIPFAYNGSYWKQNEDGGVTLPPIKIPPHDVTRGMILIADDSDANDPDAMPALYIDRAELTWGEYKNDINHQWPAQMRDSPPPEAEFMPVTYDRANHYTELEGKRLMSTKEYDFITRVLARRAPTWQKSPDGTPEAPGDAPADLNPAIAEWTNTWLFTSQSPDRATSISEMVATRSYRIVRGLAAGTAPRLTAKISDNETPAFAVSRGHDKDVGFRGVRSARPRYR